MATIMKNELGNIKDKIRYYAQLNTDNANKIEKVTTRMIGLYTTSNTKNLTSLTDEIMMQNKKIMSNNNKYVNIINRTISNYDDDSSKSERKFESTGE